VLSQSHYFPPQHCLQPYISSCRLNTKLRLALSSGVRTLAPVCSIFFLLLSSCPVREVSLSDEDECGNNMRRYVLRDRVALNYLFSSHHAEFGPRFASKLDSRRRQWLPIPISLCLTSSSGCAHGDRRIGSISRRRRRYHGRRSLLRYDCSWNQLTHYCSRRGPSGKLPPVKPI
jgi:hypothetical protein